MPVIWPFSKSVLGAAGKIRVAAAAGRSDFMTLRLAPMPAGVRVPDYMRFCLFETTQWAHEKGPVVSSVASFQGCHIAYARAHEMLLMMRAEEQSCGGRGAVSSTFSLMLELSEVDGLRQVGWLNCETLEVSVFPAGRLKAEEVRG